MAGQVKLFEDDANEPTSVAKGDAYSAKDIEVLEGLEPVRRRPGMYIGGTDERAVHHLFAEVLDNSMDEAVAGHASWIDVELIDAETVLVSDNGRGIPVDKHPKYPGKSALEVIMTTLHSGGKFSNKAYETSGGLHGVGISVVNALSSSLKVEVARDKKLYAQSYSQGEATTKLAIVGPAPNRRGTRVIFTPDQEIFGNKAKFKPARLFQMAKSKAYLHRGAEIRWKCNPALLSEDSPIPTEAKLHFPNGLTDQLAEELAGKNMICAESFSGRVERSEGKVEWAIGWVTDGFGEADGFCRSYCNTIPTAEGGTHELGLRAALLKGLRAYGEMKGSKKTGQITADDVLSTAGSFLSVFIREPEFQGQTKDKLSNPEAQKLVEQVVRDAFDHWLAAAPKEADKLFDWAMSLADERMKRRKEKEISRQSATRKLRLPGKLADCSDGSAEGTELFIVEGDSAGGSAKQARNRKTQAILPLRGKILNVASAGSDKLAANKELSDLELALGTASGKRFNLDDLRYERIIIMTDADVDGAHIAALLMTYFFTRMPELVRAGRLYLALPPLYKLSAGGKTAYAVDDLHKDLLIEEHFKGKKVEIGRFKGLGEMMPAQLKETAMNPDTRTMALVTLPEDEANVAALVETLMGRKAEGRFQYLQENAQYVEELDA